MARRRRKTAPAESLPPRLARLVRLAQLALVWEAFWPALAPVLALAGLTVAAAWLQLFQALPAWAHMGVLGLLGGAGLALLARAATRLRPPGRAAALRRLERDNGLAHRPLSALLDRPAGGRAHGVAGALWQRHLARAHRRLAQVRPVRPRPNLAARDPAALRFGVLALLVIAAVGAHGAWGPRLYAGLTPSAAGTAGEAATLTAWIAPPDYTGDAPVFLEGSAASAGQAPAADAATASAQRLTVPAGSELAATVDGGRGHPVLATSGQRRRFARDGPSSYTIEQALQESAEIAVRQGGGELGSWQITVTPDSAPEIALAAAPKATDDGSLVLTYRARDDHGLESIKARFAPALAEAREVAAPPGTALGFDAPVLDLPVPAEAQPAREVHRRLADHPWAGLPVTLTLEARDAAGQTGTSKPVTLTLPERDFDHPVAAAIAEHRRQLVRQPETAPDIAGELNELARRPGAFDGDRLAFMGLRSAAERLVQQSDKAARRSVVHLLWDVATRIEDGGLARARAEVRQVEEDLAQALSESREAGETGELDALAEELEEALADYRDALQRNLAQRLGDQADAQALERADASLEALFDERLAELRERLATGDRQGAQEILDELAQTLDQLQQTDSLAQADQQSQLAQAMRAIMRDQQALMDDTHARTRQAHRGAEETGDVAARDLPPPGIVPPPPAPQADNQAFPGGTGIAEDQAPASPDGQAQDSEAAGRQALSELRQRQAELREQLGAVMAELQGLGAQADALGEAAQAMESAERALGQGRPGAAARAQAQALSKLQQGNRQAGRQMGRQGGAGVALMPGQMPGSGRGDPLGRRPGRQGGGNGDVAIPESGPRERARDILQDLRRKRDRAPAGSALDSYLQRLLDQF